MMRLKTLVLAPLIITTCLLHGQLISEVLEYKPAPGQFINTSSWGTPSAANSLIGSLNGSLSLGVFGGYVVFKFDDPIENNANNPYGVDFVIYGNPLENSSTPELNNNVTWAEPGIVSVMKDANSNGEPDDTWYELAGSDYFFSTTTKNYSVTYTNPGGVSAEDILWTDNQGNSGYVLANVFHTQAYYPLATNFTNVDSISYTLSGTQIQDFVDQSNPSFITAAGRPWGYVDNNLRNTYDGLPDNPYTDNIEEGSGGDAFDISWAIDANGNYVDLDEIDFIKVHNATLADAGWLGEVSTEITGAFDVAPDASITNWESTSLVLNNIPIQASMNETFLLEAAFFDNGRKVDVGDFSWTTTPSNLATIDESNQLTTTNAGTVYIVATCTYNGKSYSDSMATTIIAPASVEITEVTTSIRVGGKYLLEAEVVDQNDNTVEGLSMTWTTSNENISIITEDDYTYLTGEQTGTATLYVSPNGYPDIKDSVDITILESAGTVDVYLSIKTGSETFFEKSKITASNYDLTPYIKNPNQSYGIEDIGNVTAAHAIASVFDNVSFESDLRYKDTETEGLYIYKLPVISGSITTNYYGYGNLGEDSDTTCWMVKIGSNTYYMNLEEVTLYQDDEIMVYYVDNIEKNWSLFNLTASNNTIETNQAVEVTLIRDIYFMYSETTVMQDSSKAAANETININGEPYTTTNSEGKATLSFQNPGTYTVEAAGETLALTVTDGTAIDEETIHNLAVFPNPANQSVSINAPYLSGSTIIKVLSITGKVFFENETCQWNGECSINISNWPNGVYMVQLINAGNISVRKVTVKH